MVGQKLQQQQSRQQAARPLLADLDPARVQGVIQRLFVILEGSMVSALCKLSVEVVIMQKDTDVGTGAGTGISVDGTLDAEGATIPSATTSATSFVKLRTELFTRGNPHSAVISA